MNTLEERKKNRWLMLHKFYELADGSPNRHIISLWDVGEEFGWDRAVTETTYDYLEGEGLLEAMSLGGGATITHRGVKEVEAAEEHPQNSTLHFPPHIVNGTNTGDSVYNISGGQQGAVGNGASAHDFSQQTVPISHQPMELKELANELARVAVAARSKASEPEDQIAIGSIEAARAAADKGDASKSASFLKSSGRWALDIATDIGAKVAAEVIKGQLGVK